MSKLKNEHSLSLDKISLLDINYNHYIFLSIFEVNFDLAQKKRRKMY